MKRILISLFLGVGCFGWGVLVQQRGGTLFEAFLGGGVLVLAAIGSWVLIRA